MITSTAPDKVNAAAVITHLGGAVLLVVMIRLLPARQLAELPVGVNPSFHGLWFQAERPMRYQVSETQLDNMQKHGVPAGSWNSAVLAALFSVILFQAWRLKSLPVER